MHTSAKTLRLSGFLLHSYTPLQPQSSPFICTVWFGNTFNSAQPRCYRTTSFNAPLWRLSQDLFEWIKKLIAPMWSFCAKTCWNRWKSIRSKSMCTLQAFRMDKMNAQHSRNANVTGNFLRMEWISALFHSYTTLQSPASKTSFYGVYNTGMKRHMKRKTQHTHTHSWLYEGEKSKRIALKRCILYTSLRMRDQRKWNGFLIGCCRFLVCSFLIGRFGKHRRLRMHCSYACVLAYAYYEWLIKK